MPRPEQFLNRSENSLVKPRQRERREREQREREREREQREREREGDKEIQTLFLFRLSDLLFVLGRYSCMKTGHEEDTYLKPKEFLGQKWISKKLDQ